MAETKELSKDEKIGYHKGCLGTLVAERNELVRLVQVTENLMQVHLKELEKLGIKITAEKSKEEKK